MPAAQFNKPFVRGLEHNPGWRLAFLNNKQKLFVDVTTTKGKELYEGIFNGKTLYPDDYSKFLILAHNFLVFGKSEDIRKQGLGFAIKAFKLSPSPAPMVEIMYVATRFADLKPHITDFCKDYFDDFKKNQNLYAKQHGYRHKIEAARLACIHLQKIEQQKKNAKLVAFYDAEIRRFINLRNKIGKEKRW